MKIGNKNIQQKKVHFLVKKTARAYYRKVLFVCMKIMV